jgi:hypothetical protein
MTRQQLAIAIVLGFPVVIAALYVIVGKWRTRRALRKYQNKRVNWRDCDWTSY